MIALAAALLLGASPAQTPSGIDTWWLENDGSDGVPDADVDATRAWATTTGDRSVIVAVIDTGCDPNHPELVPALWTNPGEIPGNGIDDDGDGLVDDVHGWDFADGDADTSDPFPITHGTLVSGLVAGSVTGLAPGVTIMPLKVFSDSGSDPDFEAVASSAIEFAIGHGAKILQIAWQISAPPDGQLSQAFDDADAAGLLTVISAGNDGIDLDVTPQWPASIGLPSTIVVGASDRYDRFVDAPPLFVSNDGPMTVGLAAPTEKLTSTYPGGGHLLFTGTSASAPLVSAAAALVWSANPSLTAVQVKQILLDSADRLPGFDAHFASGGRLNAANAVAMATHACGATRPQVSLAPVAQATPGIAAVLDPLTASAPGGAWQFGDGAFAHGAVTEHAWITGGDWAATLEVVDSAGVSALARTTVSVPSRWTASPASLTNAQLVNVVSAAPASAWMRIHFASIDVTSGALILADGARTDFATFAGHLTDVTTPPLQGDTAFLFVDGSGSFLVDRIDSEAIATANHPPIAAVSGDDLGVRVGESASFDASASADPDGDPVALSWQLVDAPAGSAAALTSTSGATTSIVPDRGGAYAISLTATDPYGASSSRLAWVVTRHADTSGGCEVAPGAASPAWLPLLALAALVLRRSRR